jgi:hypothetical protein
MYGDAAFTSLEKSRGPAEQGWRYAVKDEC